MSNYTDSMQDAALTTLCRALPFPCLLSRSHLEKSPPQPSPKKRGPTPDKGEVHLDDPGLFDRLFTGDPSLIDWSSDPLSSASHTKDGRTVSTSQETRDISNRTTARR